MAEQTPLQPKARLNVSNEYNDTSPTNRGMPSSWAGSINASECIEYPKQNLLQNMMMIYFNQLEDLNDGSQKEFTDNLNFYDYTGSVKTSNGGGAVPAKNQSYQGMTQDAKVQKAITGTASNVSKVSKDAASSLTKLFKKYSRTDKSIWFLIPQTIRYNTGANWAEVNADPNMLGLLANSYLDTRANVLKDASAMVGRELLGNVADALVQGEMGNAVMKSVQNTFTDMSFTGMQRRTFQFQWTLTPKSAEELQDIDYIIRLLRFYAHPNLSSISDAGNYLNFPGQVDIEWYTKNGSDYIENAWLPKISTCVIQSVDTDFTPNGQFSFFNGGAPTSYNLSLTLTEVHPLMKIDLARGF